MVRAVYSHILNNDGCSLVQPLDWTLAASSIPYVKERLSLVEATVPSPTIVDYGAGMVVLAADCTYSEDITVHLIQTIEMLLRPSSSENKSAASENRNFALVVSTIRHKDTFAFFVSQLAQSSTLMYEDISDWANGNVEMFGHSFYVSNRDSIRTIRIKVR
jgi:hypothetical protein